MTSADSTTSHEVEGDAATVRSRVRIRELGPDDGSVVIVDEVFAGLSPRSRYLRYQSPVAELSAATRLSLTALDGCTHVALAAFAQDRPIGIVRIIDVGDGTGELAVEVVDRWQGRGVGTQLLQAARHRAADLGYRDLVGEMLVVNAAAHAALRRVFAVMRVHRYGSELTATMAVDGEPPTTADGEPASASPSRDSSRRKTPSGPPRAGHSRPRLRGGWTFKPSLSARRPEPTHAVRSINGVNMFDLHSVHHARAASSRPQTDRGRVPAWFTALRGLYADLRRICRAGA